MQDRKGIGGRPPSTEAEKAQWLKPKSVKFTEKDLDTIAWLQEVGFGDNRTMIIRKALKLAKAEIEASFARTGTQPPPHNG